MKGTFWPVMLIVAGIVLLAHNLGLLPFAPLREVLATWWPLILIVAGVAGLSTRRER